MIAVKHCSGCADDFYNGNNPLGVKTCWMRKDARLVPRLLIHINTPPPYDKKRATPRPHCYHVAQHVCITPDALDAQGFWKS